MHNALDAGAADFPPQVVFEALLANNLTSFTEFASIVAKYAAISAVVAVKPLPTTSSPPSAISWKPVRDLLTA